MFYKYSSYKLHLAVKILRAFSKWYFFLVKALIKLIHIANVLILCQNFNTRGLLLLGIYMYIPLEIRTT